jgi:dipeptidyl aminopeptidase/acylaminoacyl peptidase
VTICKAMIHKHAVALVAILVLTAVPRAPAQTERKPDGTVVGEEACAADAITTYDAYVTAAKKRYAEEVEAAKLESQRHTTPLVYLTREEFEARAKGAEQIDCRRIRYLSDSLQVVAYLWKPKSVPAQKLPLIIFNRGGNREFGKVLPSNPFRLLAVDGFVVVASQYRGNDGGEGKEEFGGADVRDVINLIPLAESLGYVDTKNVFMLGWSRGGMMTALALKQGMKVNAAAVGGPLTNLLTERARRPLLGTFVWSQLMPGYAERSEEVLRERSALFWPEQIRAPLLILQGGADWRVDPAETLAFAQALQRVGATYELVVYAGDDHGITVNRDDSNRRIVQWFRKHMR